MYTYEFLRNACFMRCFHTFFVFANKLIHLFFVAISAVCILRLAEMMENPVGDDDTDINLYQQLHQLEVHGSSRFAWRRGLGKPLG